MVTVAEAKQYLRADQSDEDGLIQKLLDTAESYIKGAVDDYDVRKANPDFVRRADVAVLAIVTELYENRGVGLQHDYSYAIRTLISQLQYVK